MISCSACGEENANKNCFCAACGRRIRPVGRRLEQDILTVVAKHRRKTRARNLTLASFILGSLGFFGYAWVEQKIATTVAGQIEAMTPAIIKEANAKAEGLFSRELPKVMDKAASDATHILVADLRQVAQRRRREIEEIYENGEREARDRTQQLSASHERSKFEMTTPTTPMTVGSPLGIPGSTVVASITKAPAFPFSDTATVPTLAGSSSTEFINRMLNTPSPAFQITTSSATVTTQTSYTPSCLGGGTFVADASGVMSFKPAECKENVTGLVGLGGRPIQ